MRYYLFYNDSNSVVGWLSTEGSCNSPNAREVGKEVYLENGGTISVPSGKKETTDRVEELLDAIIAE